MRGLALICFVTHKKTYQLNSWWVGEPCECIGGCTAMVGHHTRIIAHIQQVSSKSRSGCCAFGVPFAASRICTLGNFKPNQWHPTLFVMLIMHQGQLHTLMCNLLGLISSSLPRVGLKKTNKQRIWTKKAETKQGLMIFILYPALSLI